MPQSKPATKKHGNVKITIKKMGINGEGVGYYQRKIIFIPKALPNEVVITKITEEQPNFLRGEIVSLLQASPIRAQRPADLTKLSHSVGGLELAHVKYKAQLDLKDDVIRQSLAKFQPAGYRDYPLLPPIGAPSPWHYRYKAQFPVRKLTNRLIAGLYQPNSHLLIDLPKMPTQSKGSLQAIRQLLPILKRLNISIYDEKKDRGNVKTLIARESAATHDIQLTLVTQGKTLDHTKELIRAIRTNMPQVIGIFQNVQPEDTSLIWGESTYLLWGQPHLTEKIGSYQFSLSPRSFLQLNPPQIAPLYDRIAAALKLNQQDILLDLYAGVGTIGIYLAHQVQQVISLEVIPEAVADAKRNAERNHITNLTTICSEVASALPRLFKGKRPQPTAFVVDPPRSGLDPKTLKALTHFPIERGVYVSCNPSTLAQDLVTLSSVYDVESLQQVDMFPQTARIEVVVSLKRR